MVASVIRATGGVSVAGPSPRSGARLTTVSALAALLAVGGHVAGGGGLPTTCGVLLTVLALAVVATGSAAWAAQRTRGPWAALIALAVGQLGMEVLLSVPVDDLPAAPLRAAIVHAFVTLALGVMLLGADRTVNDLNAVVDRVLPRWWRVREPTAPFERSWRISATPAHPVGGVFCRSPRSLRGPPAPC